MPTVALVNDDLVLSIVTTNTPLIGSVPVPDKYAGAVPTDLRVANGKVSHLAEFDMFFVDQYGVRHVIPGDGRKAIAGDWTDPLVKDEDGWRLETAEEILRKAKDKAKLRIDEAAERLRATIITPGEGQVATYLAQEAEAKALSINPDTSTPTPYIDALIGIIAPTRMQVVQVVLEMSTAWNQANASINAVRLQTKGQIDAAESIEEVNTLVQNAPWPALTP